MKKSIQIATAVMVVVMSTQAHVLAQTVPPASVPGIDFTAIFPALAPMITAVVQALTAIAGVMILPFVARWGFNQVIVWFGGEELVREKEEEKSASRNMMLGG